MRGPIRRTVWATLVLMAPVVMPSVAPAADKPNGESAVLEAAVADLKKEYAAHLKNPDAAPLRSQCTYFLDHPPAAALSAQAVVEALEKPVANDPRLAAYVRWQLLSAAQTGDRPAHRRCAGRERSSERGPTRPADRTRR